MRQIGKVFDRTDIRYLFIKFLQGHSLCSQDGS
jgi:hypothetical protein